MKSAGAVVLGLERKRVRDLQRGLVEKAEVLAVVSRSPASWI